MSLEDPLLRLLARFAEEGVEYVLVGGQAVRLNGFLRATEDIDVLIRPTRDNGERIKRALSFLNSSRELDPAWFKLDADGEPAVAAPATSAIATDTRLPLSRHFDSSAALRRLSKSPRTGRAPRPVGLLRRVLGDRAARRLFLVTLIAALAGGYVALV